MSDEELPTILVSGAKMANDEYLLQKASEGCSQLLSGLWKLETEKSDAGPMAILPKYCDIVTPRELVSCHVHVLFCFLCFFVC